MKKSGVKPHQVDEQVSDANMSRRHLIQGALLSTVAVSAPIEAAEQSAHQGGDPKAEVEAIERKLMWLYSNGLPRHVNEIMEYFDDTPEMLQFDVMSPREFKGPPSASISTSSWRCSSRTSTPTQRSIRRPRTI